MNLIIVESPAKSRTIEKYLGRDYKVLASFGHVRDLPKNELGVDTEKKYTPKYVIPPKARKIISLLKDAASNSDQIYMATDYDREGEAIAWHVIQACNWNNRISHIAYRNTDKPLAISHKPIKRITFHEITQEAIKEAVQNPRELDMDLVNAQQARRILDRLVGYKLSPFLWKKLFKGLSAGRVQSVAVRLIVDREREITAFIPQEYWTVQAELEPKSKINPSRLARPEAGNQKSKFIATLIEINNKKIDKLDIKSEVDAQKIIKELEEAQYQVENIVEKEENRWPYPPFTTSTLQQEASKKLGYSAKKTMKLAQDLYEDGLITYMRTDSVNLAQIAVNITRKLIKEEFGEKYLPTVPRLYKTKSKGAQEAHEAIRPTDLKTHNSPASQSQGGQLITHNLSDDHQRLYDLIWCRMIACQMNPMILATTSVDIIAQIANSKSLMANYKFRVNGSTIKFDGFSKVWPVNMKEVSLPKLEIKEILKLLNLLKEQHFTEPPARFTEASLIKALEEHGIGRPSTYAPTISTIIDRGYVKVDNRVLFPQEIGFLVTDLLIKHFPKIVDLEFTAHMEEDLDKIAEGKEDWVKMLDDFYKPFLKNLLLKEQSVQKTQTEEKTDKICPKCSKPLVIKMGKYGKFLACTSFPDCKYTENIIISTGLKCPECSDGDIIERKTRRGKTFWGCSKYPKCKWASWDNPLVKN